MKQALLSALVFMAAFPAIAQENCTQVLDKVSFCGSGTNLAGEVGMDIAFPNAQHVSLSEEDNKYGSTISVIPVRLSGDASAPVDPEALTNALIQNATQRLWVEAKVSLVRFRRAAMGQWPGVQAEYRIVGASESLGANYVVDAYVMSDQSLLAIQSFSDANRKITNKLRAFHRETMANTRITQ